MSVPMESWFELAITELIEEKVITYAIANSTATTGTDVNFSHPNY